MGDVKQFPNLNGKCTIAEWLRATADYMEMAGEDCGMRIGVFACVDEYGQVQSLRGGHQHSSMGELGLLQLVTHRTSTKAMGG